MVALEYKYHTGRLVVKIFLSPMLRGLSDPTEENPMDWTTLLSTVGLGTVALGVVGYVLRTSFKSFVDGKLEAHKAALAHGAEVALESHRNALRRETDLALTRLSADVRVRAFVQETRIARLDERRFEKATRFMNLLHKTIIAMEEHVGEVKTVPIDSEAREKNLLERRDRAAALANEIIAWEATHSWVYPTEVQTAMKAVVKEIKGSFNKYDMWNFGPLKGLSEAMLTKRFADEAAAASAIRDSVPQLRESLRSHFQSIVSPDAPAAATTTEQIESS